MDEFVLIAFGSSDQRLCHHAAGILPPLLFVAISCNLYDVLVMDWDVPPPVTVTTGFMTGDPYKSFSIHVPLFVTG